PLQRETDAQRQRRIVRAGGADAHVERLLGRDTRKRPLLLQPRQEHDDLTLERRRDVLETAPTQHPACVALDRAQDERRQALAIEALPDARDRARARE